MVAGLVAFIAVMLKTGWGFEYIPKTWLMKIAETFSPEYYIQRPLKEYLRDVHEPAIVNENLGIFNASEVLPGTELLRENWRAIRAEYRENLSCVRLKHELFPSEMRIGTSWGRLFLQFHGSWTACSDRFPVLKGLIERLENEYGLFVYQVSFSVLLPGAEIKIHRGPLASVLRYVVVRCLISICCCSCCCCCCCCCCCL